MVWSTAMHGFPSGVLRAVIGPLVTATVMAFGVIHFACGYARECGPDPAAKWNEKIEALVNHSRPPRLVKVGRSNEFDSRTIPLFSAEYDWNEQARVQMILFSLAHDRSEELWEALVKHVEDNRYALTGRRNESDYRNYSIGDLCNLLASRRLFFVEEWKSDPTSGERPDVFLDLGIRDIAQWRKQRSSKALYELQIDVCELAQKKINSVQNISEKTKARIYNELKSMADKLKESKKPLFFDESMDGYEYFDSKRATRAREVLRSIDRSKAVEKP